MSGNLLISYATPQRVTRPVPSLDGIEYSLVSLFVLWNCRQLSRHAITPLFCEDGVCNSTLLPLKDRLWHSRPLDSFFVRLETLLEAAKLLFTISLSTW